MEISDLIRKLIIAAVPILVAITFHEISHGYVAYRLGDPTAKMLGRLTINPIAHIDPVGTVLMPVMLFIFTNGQFIFGYAKPVPINPSNFKNPRRDMAISAAAGPLTNLGLAVASILILKFVLFPASVLFSSAMVGALLTPLTLMFTSSIMMNVVLAAFNLIPIPPLDGGRVLAGLLPYQYAVSFSKIEPFGFIIVIILIATGLAGFFVKPMINLFLTFLQLF